MVINHLKPLSRLAGLGLVLLSLAACQTYQGTPAPTTDAGRSRSEPVDAVPPGRQPEEPQAVPRQPPQQRAYSAIATLEDKALDHLAQGQWQQAIEAAEHGLRLDRRYAAFYRVLGESYKGLGDYTRAEGFARQALRFCGQNCRAAEDLMQSLAGR